LADRFGGGVLAASGPEPVEGPFVLGPLVVEGDLDPDTSSFTWVFWVGAERRSVRIEMYPQSSGLGLAGGLHVTLEAMGHEGPARPVTLPVAIDGVVHDFYGTSVGNGAAAEKVVAGMAVAMFFFDGLPHGERVSLQTLEGPELDAMLMRGMTVLQEGQPPSRDGQK
jgi:hypothetical protein